MRLLGAALLGLVMGFMALGGAEPEVGGREGWDAAAAKRVQGLVRSLRIRPERTPQLRSVRLSNHEVNSYLNLIYRQRFFPELRAIRLAFMPPDRVRGTFELELNKDRMVGALLAGREVKASFEGRLETDQRRIRFHFDHLEINGRDMDLGLLESVFQTVQPQRKGGSLRSIADWFHLLPGAREIQVGKGFLLLFL